MADFNIQTELQSMRVEQREDHAALTKVVTDGFASSNSWMHAHELKDQDRFNALDRRLRPIETVKQAAVWLIGAVIVAWLGAAGLIYVEHQSHTRSTVEAR